MWSRPDSQEVGLEAAILERVRNSSLVEWFRADNSSGLKSSTEAAESVLTGGLVGERRGSGEVVLERTVERPRVRMPA
jgi:uncharacterized protein YehS (DUF1456 family)